MSEKLAISLLAQTEGNVWLFFLGFLYLALLI